MPDEAVEDFERSGIDAIRDSKWQSDDKVDDFGESLLAVIERTPGSTIAAEFVRAELRGRLARYKVPRRIEFGTDLPREDTGKIYKRKLRDHYWKGTENSI